MIKKYFINKNWIIPFSQANAYWYRCAKNASEIETGIVDLSKKSNMKKITISKEEQQDFFNDLGIKFSGEQLYLEGFKIYKKSIIRLFEAIKSGYKEKGCLFKDEKLAFEYDKELDNVDDFYEGVISIGLRDPKRTEIVISFGEFINGQFCDSKKSKFNDLVFMCSFGTLSQIVISTDTKEIYPDVVWDKVVENKIEPSIRLKRRRK